MTIEERRELERKIALIFTKGVTPELVRRLEPSGMSLEEFYTLPPRELHTRLSMPPHTIEPYQCGEALARARKEIEFMERHGIRAVYMHDDDYPSGLYETARPPIVLFVLGDVPLESEHSLAIVGTRRCTPYGLNFCRQVVDDLGSYFPDLCVVSGLAFGIDAAAHVAALEKGVATIAVVAHGLDTIYPAAHRDLARRIIAGRGAIVTEYPSGTPSVRSRFLERNRIVACMPSGVLVVESEIKGGSMSTAHDAFSYGRDVFALPGRYTDRMSAGCNFLIRRNKAAMATSAADIMEGIGWEPCGIKVRARQRNLFPELDGNMKIIYDKLRAIGRQMTVDELHLHTGIPVGQLMSELSEMEFEGIVLRYPGNRYETVG